MAKTYCLLDNGVVERYSAAFPLGSTTEISDELFYIGVGTICKVDDKQHNGTTRLKFYTTKKRVKKHGKRKKY